MTRKPRPIRTWRVLDVRETRWVVYCIPDGFRAVAPGFDLERDQDFPTLPEALDYARSQTPQETP